MDNTNLKILSLLEKNSRMSYTDISKTVNLSVPSVIDRIERMIDDGTIIKRTVSINYKNLNRNINAIIIADIRTNQYDDFVSFCKNNLYVHKFYRVVGAYNAIVEISVEDTDRLEEMVDKIKRYGKTITSIITNTIFENSVLDQMIKEKDSKF